MKRIGLLAMTLAIVLSNPAACTDDFYVIAGGRGVGTQGGDAGFQ
jgi:hypothetical protein